MKVLLCGIAKCENNYLQEWVDYYRSLGFDKIVLYDNNDMEGERIDVVGIEIVNYRGRTICQRQAYTECYNKYKNDYDWFAFLDIDEFLEVDIPLKDWLSENVYNPYHAIMVNWMSMTDNGLIEVLNGNYSRDRFTEHLPIEHRHNRYQKSIVRGGLQIAYTKSVHHPSGHNLRFCNIFGEQENASNRTKEAIWDIARIKHYRTRTIQEYLDFKAKRLYADQSVEKAKECLSIDNFFTSNDKTPEKLKYIRQRCSLK